MKVILTGANGFLGRYVLNELIRQGHEIVALTRSKIGLEKNASWIECDLFDYEKIRNIFESVKPEGLIHLAWQSSFNDRWGSHHNLHSGLATVKLLEIFANAGGKKAVIAGTCAEYDWRFGCCVEGETPTNPVTVYGKSKDITRQIAEEFCSKSGVELVWARIFFAFGEGEKPERLMPYVINKLLQNQSVKCTHGNQFRDYIHAEDVANAMVLLLKSHNAQGVYNISTGLPLRIRDIVQYCSSKISSKSYVDFGSIPVPINDPLVLIGDSAKLRSLGWKPLNDNFVRISNYINALQAAII